MPIITPTNSNDPLPQRRFSMRSLIGAVALMATLLVWVGNEIRHKREGQRLVTLCEALGASISYTGAEGGKVTGLHFADHTALNNEHLN